MAQYKSKSVAFLTEIHVIPFLGNFGASLLDNLLKYLKMVYGYIICRESRIFLIEKFFSWLNIKTCCGGVSKNFWKCQTLMGHWLAFFCLNQDFLYMILIVIQCWTTCLKPFSYICIMKWAMAQYKSKLVAFFERKSCDSIFRQLWSLSAWLFVEISENGLWLHHLQGKANLFDREDFSPG